MKIAALSPHTQATRRPGARIAGAPSDRFERSAEPPVQEVTLRQLQDRIAALEARLNPPPPSVETDAEREARYLREGGGH